MIKIRLLKGWIKTIFIDFDMFPGLRNVIWFLMKQFSTISFFASSHTFTWKRFFSAHPYRKYSKKYTVMSKLGFDGYFSYLENFKRSQKKYALSSRTRQNSHYIWLALTSQPQCASMAMLNSTFKHRYFSDF